MTGSMVVKDAPEVVESISGEEDLVRIQEKYNILMLIRLELLGPSQNITVGLVTRVALYEEAFNTRLRLSLPTIVTELLKW